MKTLVLAFFFFGVVIYGCFDVQPFKAVRRVIRRTPRPEPTVQTGPLYQDYPEPQAPLRRRHYP